MKLKNIVFAILLVIITTLLVSCSQKPATDQETGDGFLVYENRNHGIKINYPADWQKSENYPGVVVIFMSEKESEEDILQDNLVITKQEFPPEQKETLSNITKASIDYIKTFMTDSNITESKELTLAGSPAHKVVYTMRQGIYPFKIMQIWTIKDNKIYVLTYNAEPDTYDTYLPTIQAMVDSFGFI